MFTWIAKKWNSVTTKIYLFFNSDINNPKSHFLHSAVYHNDESLVKSLISRKADVNRVDNKGYVPLYYAIKNNEIDIATTLADNGAKFDLNYKGFKDFLCYAVQTKQYEMVGFLVEEGADINAFNSKGENPIYISVGNKDLLILQFLIDNNAKLNMKYTPVELTLTHVAAKNGFIDAIKILIDNKLDFNIKSTDGESPLMAALISGNVKIAHTLIDAGAKFNIYNDGSITFSKVAKNGHIDSAKFLLGLGVNINCIDEDGLTPLCHAFHSDKMLKFLCENGADVNCVNNNGNTVLHNAVIHNKYEQIKILLEHGAQPDTLNKASKSPLYNALENGNVGIAKLLMKYGAPSHVRCIQDSKLLINAAKNNYKETTDMLFKMGLNIDQVDSNGYSALWHALYNNNVEIAAKLIAKNATFNTNQLKNIELAHNAAIKGYPEVINLLSKLDVNLNTLDSHGHTPLYYAIHHYNNGTLKSLLSNGADINKPDSITKRMPLFQAIVEKNDNAVNELLMRGADGDLIDYGSQQSPTVKAIKDGNTYCAKLLIQNIKHVDAYDVTTGQTLLQLALSNNLPDIAELLIIRGANVKLVTSDTFESTLHLAVKHCNSLKTVDMLIKSEVNPKLKNIEGKTAYDYAVLQGKYLISEKLYEFEDKIIGPSFPNNDPYYNASAPFKEDIDNNYNNYDDPYRNASAPPMSPEDEASHDHTLIGPVYPTSDLYPVI